MMDRKGRLSLAEASVVLTPLSMIMPAWGEGTFRPVASPAGRGAPPQSASLPTERRSNASVALGIFHRSRGSAVREVKNVSFRTAQIESGIKFPL